MLTTRTAPGDDPLKEFVEGVVRPRTLVGAAESGELRVVFATFEAGARNLWHTHGFDQGLLITDGDGPFGHDRLRRCGLHRHGVTMSDHRLHALDCGAMTLPRQIIYAHEGPEPLAIPIRAFVITHPDGDVLVDSGLPLEALQDPSYWSWLTYATWTADPRHHVRAQVLAAGLDPDAIRYVVQSHLHYDHIGGIGHFPAAEFLVHRREWDYAHDPSDWISEASYPLADIDRPDVRWRLLDLTAEDRELAESLGNLHRLQAAEGVDELLFAHELESSAPQRE